MIIHLAQKSKTTSNCLFQGGPSDWHSGLTLARVVTHSWLVASCTMSRWLSDCKQVQNVTNVLQYNRDNLHIQWRVTTLPYKNSYCKNRCSARAKLTSTHSSRKQTKKKRNSRCANPSSCLLIFPMVGQNAEAFSCRPLTRLLRNSCIPESSQNHTELYNKNFFHRNSCHPVTFRLTRLTRSLIKIALGVTSEKLLILSIRNVKNCHKRSNISNHVWINNQAQLTLKTQV